MSNNRHFSNLVKVVVLLLIFSVVICLVWISIRLLRNGESSFLTTGTSVTFFLNIVIAFFLIVVAFFLFLIIIYCLTGKMFLLWKHSLPYSKKEFIFLGPVSTISLIGLLLLLFNKLNVSFIDSDFTGILLSIVGIVFPLVVTLLIAFNSEKEKTLSADLKPYLKESLCMFILGFGCFSIYIVVKMTSEPNQSVIILSRFIVSLFISEVIRYCIIIYDVYYILFELERNNTSND